MTINRRRFLRAMGLSVAAGATSGYAGAGQLADDVMPKRLIVLSTCRPSAQARWAMNPWRRPDAQAWEGELTPLPERAFSPALRPLFPHRERLIVLDGLRMTSAALDPQGERHERGRVHAWTGANVRRHAGGVRATRPSLDQLVAARIARPGRLPSLELRVGQGRQICHDARGRALPMEADLRQTWARLFGLSGASAPPTAPPASALDALLAEYAAQGAQLPADERVRMSAHLAQVQQLERRLEGLSTEAVPQSPAGFARRFDLSCELVCAAFACDLTRVATLSLGELPGAVGEDAHARLLARLIRRLESTPEGEGTMMDHALIVWGDALAGGGQADDRFPALTVGGQWVFTTGRYLRWPEGEQPHHHLLVSVARAMGLEVEAVGMDMALTPAGELIDLTGELFEMY